MAELLLKVGSGSGYEDGDILVAVNNIDILRCHAEHIASPRRAGVNKDGWRPTDSLAEIVLRLTREYRFERISKFEIMRINQWTGEQDILGPKPNSRGEYIDVPLYLARCKRARAEDGGPKHAIFGTDMHERWYGGAVAWDERTISRVWDEIEDRTKLRRQDHRRWPWGRLELRHMLVLPCDDFTSDQARILVEPITIQKPDGTVEVVRKRKRFIEWRDAVSGLPKARSLVNAILDRNYPVDVRDTMNPVQIGNIVREKIWLL